MEPYVRESFKDEREEHEEAVARLRAQYDRLQRRIDEMHLDKLDGRVSVESFDRMSARWREEQEECQRLMLERQ